MAKRELTLTQAEELVAVNDRYFWDGWTLCYFRPGRGGGIVFSKNAWYNREWKSKQKWGFLKRITITDKGTYYV